MAGVELWQYLVFPIGLFLFLAGILTRRRPKRGLRRGLRSRNVDRETIIDRVSDPRRIQQTRREASIAVLLGTVMMAVALPVGGDLRFLLTVVALGLIGLFLIVERRHRSDATTISFVILAIGLGYLALEAGADVGLLGGVLGLLAIVRRLAGNGDRGVERRTFHYRCLHCDREFESGTANMAKATCDECGGTRVATAIRE